MADQSQRSASGIGVMARMADLELVRATQEGTGKQMKHMLLKATMTAADEGIFEAIISAPTIDREKDIVDPSAMVAALQKWTPTGKNIPLAWNHSSQSADQIGYVDPSSARVVGDEVAVSGWIDQSTPVGADAWRLVKMGTLGFSFGYLIPDGGATPRKGGGLHITELDVFEVTATPTPMNNDTRVLGFKAEVDEDTSKALQRHAESLAAEVVTEGVDLKATPAEPEPANDLELQEVKAQLAEMRETLENLTKKAGERERDSRSMDPLRAKTDALALEIASDGESLLKPPQKKTRPPEPGMTLTDMRDWWYANTLETLSEDLKP